MANERFTSHGYLILSPREKALRFKSLQANPETRISGKDNARKAYHPYGKILDSSDETYQFDPDWTVKDLERIEAATGSHRLDAPTTSVLLEGFKSPNSHDRSNQKPKRVIYLDKRTKNQVQKILNKYSYKTEIDGKKVIKKPDLTLQGDDRNSFLSEMQCCLHHLNYNVNLSTGRIKYASQALALLVEILYTEKYWNNTDWYWLSDSLMRRCYSNNFQGDWGTIFQLLEVSSYRPATLARIRQLKEHPKFRNRKGNFSTAAWNDFRKRGQEARSLVTYSISLSDPVKHKQFKRGFQHGNSENNPSITKDEESDLLLSYSEWSRDLRFAPPSVKQSQQAFLYNSKLPVKVKIPSAEGKYFNKTKETLVHSEREGIRFGITLEKVNNQLEEWSENRKRIEQSYEELRESKFSQEYLEASQPSEVVNYKWTPEELKFNLQRLQQMKERKPKPEVIIRHLEMEQYK